MSRPTITVKQLNRLNELIDDACLGKTPFVCADGQCSDRFMERLRHVTWDYFNVVEADQ